MYVYTNEASRMAHKQFEQYEVGETFESYGRTVTETFAIDLPPASAPEL